MHQKCAEHLWGRTPFGRYRQTQLKENVFWGGIFRESPGGCLGRRPGSKTFAPSLTRRRRCPRPNCSEDATEGWKKEGVENLTNDTPPKNGFWTPPRTVRFPPPSGVGALFFLYRTPRQSRPEALLEGSKNFRESAFSGTFSSPHTFCTPPYHGPNCKHPRQDCPR